MIRAFMIAAASVSAVIALAVPASAQPSHGNSGWKVSPSCYIAASGDCVESPDSNTSNATAICGDGSDSHSESRSGTCSRHGGVAQWCPCGGAAQSDPIVTSDGDTAQNVGSFGNSPDDQFIRLLTNPDQDHPMTVWNAQLLESQARVACAQMDNGLTPINAIYSLQRAAPYSFDEANDIVSSGTVIYCPWHEQTR